MATIQVILPIAAFATRTWEIWRTVCLPAHLSRTQWCADTSVALPDAPWWASHSWMFGRWHGQLSVGHARPHQICGPCVLATGRMNLPQKEVSMPVQLFLGGAMYHAGHARTGLTHRDCTRSGMQLPKIATVSRDHVFESLSIFSSFSALVQLLL